MNILILSSPHPKIAAGIVAEDILKGLSSIDGNNVRLVTRAWDNYEDKRIIPIETLIDHVINALIRKIKKHIRIFIKYFFKDFISKEEKIHDYLYSDYYFEYQMDKMFFSTRKIMRRTGFIPDIVLALFTMNFISYENLSEINKRTGAKIFLYMMDMAPFTGGCHYSVGCDGYAKNCGNCPALNLKISKDQSFINFHYKHTHIDNIIPIVASEWQHAQINKSSLFHEKPKYKVLLSVNENIYFPTDKKLVREELGLPVDKKIIFFGAVNVNEKRKGFDALLKSLEILFENTIDPSEIHLIIAGKNTNGFSHKLPFLYTLLGYLDHNMLPKAFQAADVFVSPSIEDSGPMMVNQSIMSGTPVVAFEMGVVLDLVNTGTTGYRAKLNDICDFANGIKNILELQDEEYDIMSSNCRITGLNLCKSKKNIEDLMNIFNN